MQTGSDTGYGAVVERWVGLRVWPIRPDLPDVCLRVSERHCRSNPFPLLSFHSVLELTPIFSIAPRSIPTWQLPPITQHPRCSVVVLQDVIRWPTSPTATCTYAIACTCTTSGVRREIQSTTHSPRPHQITDPLPHTHHVQQCHATTCRKHRSTCAGATPSTMSIVSAMCRKHRRAAMPAFGLLLRTARPFSQAPPILWRSPALGRRCTQCLQD